MRVHVLGSGSKGNAVVLESARETVLVDAGFGPRTLAHRMRATGIPPESVSTVIVTHEHFDHICGAERAAARFNWKVAATAGTLRWLSNQGSRTLRVDPQRELLLDDFSIRFFRTPHDASEPVALVATSRSSGARVGIAYDLGRVPGRFASHFAQLDVLLIEANYDDEMLWNGPYPTGVKQRIAGPVGHLSNAQSGSLARSCVHTGLRHLVLCHLSEVNNTPNIALSTVSRALRGMSRSWSVQMAAQDELLTVEAGRLRRSTQLSLDL
jgi:phosphoribosyl 1,2-cyclic phosphodiesterase